MTLADVLAGVALLLVVNGFRPEPRVTFRPPEGWIDLSPGAPRAALEGLPEALRAEALSGKYAAMAIEPAQPGGRYTQTFNAIVSPRVSGAADDRTALERNLVEGMQRLGATARVERREVLEVGGVEALRLELRVDVDDADVHARRLVWAIPAGRRTALLSYTCEESTCARLLPTMDASARATKGIAAPGVLARVGIGRDVEQAVATILCGLAVIWVSLRRRKGRSPTASPPAPATARTAAPPPR